MNAVPTRGMPISAATPAAPPATPAGRTNRAKRLSEPSHDPAATPRCAAGASVPIGAPRPTVARDRDGADRCEPPREALLFARRRDHVGGEIGASDVAREHVEPRAALRLLLGHDPLHGLALGQAVEHEHREAHADQRQHEQQPRSLSRHDRERPLDHLGGDHGCGGTAHATYQAPEQRGLNRRPPRRVDRRHDLRRHVSSVPAISAGPPRSSEERGGLGCARHAVRRGHPSDALRDRPGST